MPVPLPGPDSVLLVPPDFDEANATARGIAYAAAPAEGLTDAPRILLGALYSALTGHDVDLENVEPITAEQFDSEVERSDVGRLRQSLGARRHQPVPGRVRPRPRRARGLRIRRPRRPPSS